MKFKFLKGNIADVEADAIVLPANTKLKEGSGASEAIFEAAGRKKLAKACSRIEYCETGSAVPTLAYDLHAHFIIHAAVPRWRDGDHREYELLSTTYASALELADVMKCRSVAFPLLASGNNGFDLRLALEIAIESIRAYEPENLETVSIVLFGNNITQIVKNEGYEVRILPRNLEEDIKEEEEWKAKKKKLDDLKNTVEELAEDHLKEGLQIAVDVALAAGMVLASG